ncbi:hypothetical protein ACET3Z_009148 [Daucus carota]
MGSYGYNYERVVGVLVLCLFVMGSFAADSPGSTPPSGGPSGAATGPPGAATAPPGAATKPPGAPAVKDNDATCYKPCLEKCMNHPSPAVRTVDACDDACHGQCG